MKIKRKDKKSRRRSHGSHATFKRETFAFNVERDPAVVTIPHVLHTPVSCRRLCSWLQRIPRAMKKFIQQESHHCLPLFKQSERRVFALHRCLVSGPFPNSPYRTSCACQHGHSFHPPHASVCIDCCFDICICHWQCHISTALLPIVQVSWSKDCRSDVPL